MSITNQPGSLILGLFERSIHQLYIETIFFIFAILVWWIGAFFVENHEILPFSSKKTAYISV